MDILKTEQASDILLPPDVDYMVTRCGKEYQHLVNVTYKWPRKLKCGPTIPLIVTTTIRSDELNRLRVEEKDGQYFVINDPSHRHFVIDDIDELSQNQEGLMLTVVSEEIGYKIIKAIIDECAPPVSSKKEIVVTDDHIQIPEQKHSRVDKINNAAQDYSPILFVTIGILSFFFSVIIHTESEDNKFAYLHDDAVYDIPQLVNPTRSEEEGEILLGIIDDGAIEKRRELIKQDVK